MTLAQHLLRAFLVAGGIWVMSGPAGAQEAKEGWPCVQVLQPELSIGAMWSGPDPTQATREWRELPEVVSLVQRIAPRRLPLEEAEADIRRFAAGLGDDRAAVLTEVFAGLFETLGKERRDIIRGIRRYYSRQQKLAERIEQATAELDGLDRASTDPKVLEQRAELEAQLLWDTRIFDDRERLLPAVCEQPVILERRLFALSRALQAEMGE